MSLDLIYCRDDFGGFEKLFGSALVEVGDADGTDFSRGEEPLHGGPGGGHGDGGIGEGEVARLLVVGKLVVAGGELDRPVDLGGMLGHMYFGCFFWGGSNGKGGVSDYKVEIKIVGL